MDGAKRMNRIPELCFYDFNQQHTPCLVDTFRERHRAPEPRYTMVEVGPEAIPALEQHWQTGQPVELLGVVFEFAVVAKTRKRLFRADRYVVRGIRQR